MQKFGAQGIFIIVNIILARLLTPDDFGLVGMLAIFIALSQVLSNAGFNTALIQKLNVNEQDYSSVFFINLFISILLYCLLFLLSPLISKFYHQPILVPLTRVLSLVFVINSFSYVQTAKLQRNVRFKTLMYINIPSTIIGGIISVAMAFLGFGVWSLVAMQLITNFSYAVQIWIYSKWKPKFEFNLQSVRELFSFGSKIALSNIIHFTYMNIYPVILGRCFPLSTVGYYQTASKFTMTPGDTVMIALKNAVFPIFSTLQNDNNNLKKSFRIGLRQVTFFLFPLFTLMGVLADPLIQFVFTKKWLPAVPYFRWLCIVAVFLPLSTYNTQLINVKGKSALYLRLNILEKSIFFIGIVLSIPFGISILLAVQAISAVMIYCINSFISTRLIEYSAIEQIGDILPSILLSLVIGLGIYFLDSQITGLSNLLRLFYGFILGGGTYWVTSRYIGLTSYKELAYLYRTRFSRKVQP